MSDTKQFTVGQHVHDYESLKALPVGTRLTREDTSSSGLYWTTNGDEATRSNDGTTLEWELGGWVERGWFIDTLPAQREWEVGQAVEGFENLKALPPGTKLIRPTMPNPERTYWITNGEDGATRHDDTGIEDTDRWGSWISSGWEIAALPEVEPAPEPSVLKVGDRVRVSNPAYTNDGGMVDESFYGQVGIITDDSEAKMVALGYRVEVDGDFNWISGEYLTLEKFHVGYVVHTVEDCMALPVGTAMEIAGSGGTITRTKQADGRWNDRGDLASPAGLSLEVGYTITHLPGVQAEPSLASELLDDGPMSEETVRQFKARFYSLAMSASYSSEIDMDPVERYLELGGFYREDATVGMPVYGEDHWAFENLPSGTVLKQEIDEDPGLWITDGTSEPEHIHGSGHRDKFYLYRVAYIPGMSRTADAWLRETMTPDEARAAHREIEDLKLLIWDLGNKGRDESEAAGDRWCSVFEDTMAEVGIDETFARSKGWTPTLRKEEITVTITVTGETCDTKDLDYARGMVGGGADIVDFEAAKVAWTKVFYLYNVEVDEDHCACDGYDKTFVEGKLGASGVNFTEFGYHVACDND